MNAHSASASRNPLPPWQRLTLYTANWCLSLSGAVWLVLHYAVGGPMEGLPHPGEAWAMRTHGLGVFIALFVLGILAAAHIPKGWRMVHRRRGRHLKRQSYSGLALCALAAILVVTGYALYYFVSENLRPSIGWAHAGCGFAMFVLIIWHGKAKPRRVFDTHERPILNG